MKKYFHKAGKLLLQLLLPKTCVHCRTDLHYLSDEPLCPACNSELRPITGLFCAICGVPLPDGGAHCFNCRNGKALVLNTKLVRSAFKFNPQLRSLIHAYKYSGRKALARPLGQAMAAALAAYPELKPYIFLLPVPLYKKKEAERGFNQAELLAEIMAGDKKLFLLSGAAVRTRDTPSQACLSKAERKTNIDGAFKITRPELIKSRRILIVDDVATTLATTEELAKVLKEAGAAEVAVYTLARE